jgi:hypothetical protein
MLQGRMIFSYPNKQIMAIGFAACMESCLIAKHQELFLGVRYPFQLATSRKSICFMQTGLRRTCNTVVFSVCNSLLHFLTDFLDLRSKVASTCRTASSLTWGRPQRFFLQTHPWFSKCSSHLCVDARGGRALRNRFLTACWTLLLEPVLAYSTTQIHFSTGDVFSESCGAWSIDR